MDERERMLNTVATIPILTGAQNVPGPSRENAVGFILILVTGLGQELNFRHITHSLIERNPS
jgi:hypothetical protein